MPVAMRFSLSLCLERFQNGQIWRDGECVEEETTVVFFNLISVTGSSPRLLSVDVTASNYDSFIM